MSFSVFETVRQFGDDALAYSSLLPNISYFRYKNGFIPYVDSRHYGWAKKLFPLAYPIAVLGEPMIAKSDKRACLSAFIHRYPKAAFFHIGSDTASYLNARGYYVNAMGLENNILLNEFNDSIHAHPAIKEGARKALKETVHVYEDRFESFSMSLLKKITKSWCLSRTHPSEKQHFFTPPFPLYSEPDVRYFFAFHNTRLIGFRRFEPIYHQGHIYGYYANQTRVDSYAPSGTDYLLLFEAIRVFKGEQKKSAKHQYYFTKAIRF